MSPPIVKFESFFNLPKFFYFSIGVEPYEHSYWKTHSYLLQLFFWINIVNLNFVLIEESMYVFMAMYHGSNFLEATMNLSYIGFVFVGDIKIGSIVLQKSKITKFMQDLRAVFPHEEKLEHKQTASNVLVVRKESSKQQAYDVYDSLRSYNIVGFAFSLINVTLAWTYNLFPLVSTLLYKTPYTLPYFCWLPWDWHDHWSYPFIYASQNLAGHTCMNGQIANDLLLCVVVTQIIMHYRFLASRISQHVIAVQNKKGLKNGESIGSKAKDLEFLTTIIDYHQRILSLSDTMNDIFGVSLLLNWLTSAFIMCFLGFQMTIGGSTATLVKLFLFIFCSLIQVYMISNYAQNLILTSESIGHAIYNHDWYNADMRYKKMLVLIMQRSQKPAIMQATTFLNISLGTMTDLIQLSYKFFALLRTMYSK